MVNTATRRGVLIGIEGIDAAGKRTQTSLLVGWLKRKGVTTSTASFPDYSTSIGREIRGFLQGRKEYSAEVRHILFAANRWEDRTRIESLMSKSKVTVVNRYTASNFAYGIANGLDLEWLMNLEVGLPVPDLTMVLDAPPAELYRRRGPRKDNYERSSEIQEKARRAYRKLAERFGWKVVDASLSVRSTHELVVSAVAKALSSRGVLAGRGGAS